MPSKHDHVLDELKEKFAQIECQPGDDVTLVHSINSDLHDPLDASFDALNYARQRTPDGRAVFRVVPAIGTTTGEAANHD